MGPVTSPELFAAQRLQVPAAEISSMRDLVADLTSWWATVPGYVDHALVQNLDEPGLWLLWSRWVDVGSYRRAMGGQAKYLWLPIMHWIVDEPTAYTHPDELGVNIPRQLE